MGTYCRNKSDNLSLRESQEGGNRMPTDRFYRLPEEKKQIIREAAIREFARVPFDKASINQIILHADISRGSFYTYFADKQDVVSFIFEDSHEQIKQQCKRMLDEYHGNFFLMLQGMFEYFVEKLHATKNMMDMVRNVFAYQENTSAMGLGDCHDLLEPDEIDPNVEWIFHQVDRTGWRLKGKEDCNALLTMGMAALMMALGQYYKFPEQLELIRNSYRKRLDILQHGVYENV